jgi:hypothetical protein
MFLLQGNGHLEQDWIVIIDTSSLNTKITKIDAKENSIIRLVLILIIIIVQPAKVVVVEQVKQKVLVAIFLIVRVGPIKR